MNARAAMLMDSETKAFRRMIILSIAVHVVLVGWVGWRSYQASASRISLNASAPMGVMWAHTVQVPKKTPSYKLPGPRVLAKPKTKAKKKAAKPKVVLSKPKKTKAAIKQEKEEVEAKQRADAMNNALASLADDLQPTPRPDNFPSKGEGKDAYAGSPTGGIAGILGGNAVFAGYRARIERILVSNLIWLQPPPPLATVEFKIDEKGYVSDSKLAASSGNPSFDSASLRAVRKSNPLPAPPPELAQDIVGEWFSINFDLNQR